MITIENYEIAFSRDVSVDGAPEVALLVLEKQDLAQDGFVPLAVRLVEDPSEPFPQLFIDSSSSHTDSVEPLVVCPGVPVDTLDALSRFDTMWVCVVDQGEVVDEHLLPFVHSLA